MRHKAPNIEKMSVIFAIYRDLGCHSICCLYDAEPDRWNKRPYCKNYKRKTLRTHRLGSAERTVRMMRHKQ